ncbi:MAG: chemotaxis protein CheW [Candidatus Eiseniibacteriota bacterium]
MNQPGDEIVREFLVESYENLEQLDLDFVALERNPSARPLLSRIFRTIHTIPGTCGFLGFHRLEAVAHAGESLLSALRDELLVWTPEIASALLALVDAVRAILRRIEATGDEGPEAYPQVIAALERLRPGAAPLPAASNAPSPAPSSAPSPAPSSAPSPAPRAISPAAESAAAEAAPRAGGESDVRLFDGLVNSGRLDPDALKIAVEQQRRGDRRRLGEILVDHGALQPQEVLEALMAREEGAAASAADGHLRVDLRVLDRLVTLVSELVLARNQLLQGVAGADVDAMPVIAQRLNVVTTELQEAVLKTRMQPIGNLWNKLPRLVRDVASTCGKSVRLEMEGNDTELDKSVLEIIRDPFIHLVRNAVDHGIEGPEIRTACGKLPEGTVRLSASHEGGYVFIEIADDGAGLPIERIRRKAVERKVVTAEVAAALSEHDLAQFIFLPGFSTASAVSAISGRGVGMDVVKTNIERIGGTVELHSTPAAGTTIYLKIPLTLAIVPALIVTDAGERFAIPQSCLQELLRIEAANITHAVERVHEAPVIRLRDTLLPLVFLRELLHQRRAFSDFSLAERAGVALHVVVLRVDGHVLGLVVDEIDDAEEIVVKPIADVLKRTRVLAGATILGDGRVGMILDPLGVARAAGLAVGAERPAFVAPAQPRTAVKARRLLVVEPRSGWRVAVPLERVSRLEAFASASIEQGGYREVVQYHGSLLPILSLARVLDPRAREEAWPSHIPAVVFDDGPHHVALGVSNILDVVDESPDESPVAGRPFVRASAISDGRVVDLLDVDAVLARAASLADGEERAA